MNKFFTGFLLLANLLRSQDTAKTVLADTLIFTNQIKLKVKVMLIDNEKVQYKKINNLNGPVYNSPKADVARIAYASGSVERIDSAYAATKELRKKFKNTVSFTIEEREMYNRGVKDAVVNYKNRGGSVETGITSFLLGPLGLVPAILYTTVPINEKQLNYQDTTLWQNQFYQKGYLNRAERMRRSRVWSGFGVGIGSSIVVSIMILPKG